MITTRVGSNLVVATQVITLMVPKFTSPDVHLTINVSLVMLEVNTFVNPKPVRTKIEDLIKSKSIVKYRQQWRIQKFS